MVSRRMVLSSVFILIIFLAACSPGKSSAPQPAKESMTAPAEASAKQGWKTEWEKTLTQARKEARVIVYASSGIGQKARIKAIEKMKERFNIDTEILMLSGSELSRKLFSERKAGLFLQDVYMGGTTTVVTQLLPEKILDPIEAHLILPEVRDTKAWYGGRLHYIDAEKRSLAFIAFPIAQIARNIAQVKEGEVQSWQNLLEPKWKGKMLLDDPSTAGAGMNWFTMVGFRIRSLDFMKEFARQEPVIIRDHRLQADWLAQGKYPLLVAPTISQVQDFINNGAPIKFLMPSEGTYLSNGAGSVGIMNSPAHPNAARIFINWLLSREGQLVLSEGTGQQSAREDVPVTHLDPMSLRDAGVKYYSMTEEDLKDQTNKALIAKEIFGHLLR